MAFPLRPQGKTLILGHRGAKGYAPENTFPSFQKALELGVDIIELDVHITKDGRIIVCHDDSLDRTTGLRKLIGESTWDEIRNLDAGKWFGPEFAGAKIPLLEEVLEWARGRIPLVVEIKRGFGEREDIVEKTVEIIKECKMEREVELISFDHRFVRKAKEIAPEIPGGILYVGALIDPVRAARDALADALHPHFAYVDKALIEKAHEAGLAVSAWVVNDPETARLLALWGVDCIGSDYPDRVKKALESL
ncbi:MAG: glycerophosphodiester phosphodiesterase family protein [Anaerolineae bacterium]|nr:glycerophosphodiester phosphodiesterase [Anaerolineae bacterium]MDW8101718.1 glycerophosphodiester phosphodiesterase family protein [Anaerolineae bacterium]